MKKEKMVLTYDQAKELKWFCRCVVGTRQEFYQHLDEMNTYKDKMDRLYKTCQLIEKFLGEEIKPFESPFLKEMNNE